MTVFAGKLILQTPFEGWANSFSQLLEICTQPPKLAQINKLVLTLFLFYKVRTDYINYALSLSIIMFLKK